MSITIEKSAAWAVRALGRAAGHCPATEAPPPPAIVAEATALLQSSLPRPAIHEDPAQFETRMLAKMTYDVDGWWAGTVSGKTVVVPRGISDAFVQRAGGDPGVILADHLRAAKAVVAAEAGSASFRSRRGSRWCRGPSPAPTTSRLRSWVAGAGSPG
jgi:hypothetical protein